MMEAGLFWRGHPLEASLQGRIWLRKSEVCEELVEGGSGREGGQAEVWSISVLFEDLYIYAAGLIRPLL